MDTIFWTWIAMLAFVLLGLLRKILLGTDKYGEFPVILSTGEIMLIKGKKHYRVSATSNGIFSLKIGTALFVGKRRENLLEDLHRYEYYEIELQIVEFQNVDVLSCEVEGNNVEVTISGDNTTIKIMPSWNEKIMWSCLAVVGVIIFGEFGNFILHLIYPLIR